MSIYEIIYYVALALISIKIIVDSDTPSKAIVYLFLVFFNLYLGVVIYFLFGINYRKNKLYEEKLQTDRVAFEKLQNKIDDYPEKILNDKVDDLKHFTPLAKLISQENNLASDNNTARLLVNGENKFPEVRKALLSAKHHIHIEYYTFEDDNIGKELGEILMQKVSEGVEVRLIYDDVGSHALSKGYIDKLREAGVQAVCFYEIKFYLLANRLNYRNHRKIIIVDGVVGFVGGINVADCYVNKEDYNLFWRDTHLKIEGLSVMGLQNIFLADWNFCSDDQLDITDVYFPVDQKDQIFGRQFIQVTASGPDSTHPNILYALILAVYLAKEEVLLTTPYFIPETSFMDALKVAVLSGVKVKLLVPYKGDNVIVNATSKSYYEELLQVGVEIYRYKKGFVHAKTMVCDGMVSFVGTANIDQRSFDLNFEVNAVLYGKDFADGLRQTFMDDIEDAIQIHYDEWVNRPVVHRFVEKVIKIFSPIL